ncbi:hypothetical protein [Botrimarina mediterranea]|uniref:hypothetical protein n=1 Tax=Botrimarina mediterranea TaxID=2528022 RepID=UPI00118A89D7|nr:hypothetical protein K2D_34920 [Planctomycetes bacterium K2D]
MTPKQRLKNWVKGKSPLFCYLAIPAAFAAEMVHELIATREGERVQQTTTDRTDQAWERYYSSTLDWVMELPLGSFPSPIPLCPQVLSELMAGDPSAPVVQQLKRLEEPLQGPTASGGEAPIEELIDCWTTGGPPAFAAEEFDELRALPAVSFLVRVFVPCMIRHQTTPQQLYGAATAISGPDLDALANLAEIDPEVIHLPAPRAVLHSGGPARAYASFEIVYPAMERVHSAPTLAATKRWIASGLYHVAKRFGEPLTAPQVRELFDIAAISRDPDVIVDADFGSVQKDSFARMLRRDGEHWEWLLADI